LDFHEYERLVYRTAPRLVFEDVLVMGALGLTGEAGECADYIKKNLFQEHPLDKEVLAEELGDVLWYLAFLAAELGYSLEHIAERNVTKLRKRYPNGFDSERSVKRYTKIL
jgi:NTP pyrophosphatase (non-canonical NTP hydrolase)